VGKVFTTPTAKLSLHWDMISSFFFIITVCFWTSIIIIIIMILWHGNKTQNHNQKVLHTVWQLYFLIELNKLKCTIIFYHDILYAFLGRQLQWMRKSYWLWVASGWCSWWFWRRWLFWATHGKTTNTECINKKSLYNMNTHMHTLCTGRGNRKAMGAGAPPIKV